MSIKPDQVLISYFFISHQKNTKYSVPNDEPKVCIKSEIESNIQIPKENASTDGILFFNVLFDFG